MNEAMFVAVLSLLGTLAGTLGGIVVSNKLVNYRLQQLEEKVQAHNEVVARTYKLEGQVREICHEITDLKQYHKPQGGTI